MEHNQILPALLAQLQAKDKQIEILLSTNAELVMEIKRLVAEKDAIRAETVPRSSSLNKSQHQTSLPHTLATTPVPLDTTQAQKPSPQHKQQHPQQNGGASKTKETTSKDGSTNKAEAAAAAKKKRKRKVSEEDGVPENTPAPALAPVPEKEAKESNGDRETAALSSSHQPAKKKKKGTLVHQEDPSAPPVNAYDPPSF